jgi:hypothetical protein
MASIIISDLERAGANLFRDSESFLNELTEQEVGDVLGGFWRVSLFWGLISIWGGNEDSSQSLSSVKNLSDINAVL